MDTYSTMNKLLRDELVTALLDWYDANKRDLPWRKSQEPYSIWISEIMAQQTRITAVLPYYERFMNLFPDVQALADAGPDDVLKAWEGLGYYSRAHNLQKSAQKIMTEFNGIIPSTEKELKSLPGIGDYTAGAILSISFGQPVPAVDGNVLRVFARIENNELDIALPGTKRLLIPFVKEIIPKQRTAAFSQALMELGALICIPKNPNCTDCPVSALCKAYARGRQKELPVKSAKKPLKHIDKTYLLLINPKGQILMRQRTEKLLQGLWEFYCIDQKIDELEAKQELEKLGYLCKTIIPIGPSSHTFTHMIWHMQGYECHMAEAAPIEGYRFFDKDTLAEIAIPTALRFYLDWLHNRHIEQLTLSGIGL